MWEYEDKKLGAVSILDQVKSKNAGECLETWLSDKSPMKRHIDINNIDIPFQRDNQKGIK